MARQDRRQSTVSSVFKPRRQAHANPEHKVNAYRQRTVKEEDATNRKPQSDTSPDKSLADENRPEYAALLQKLVANDPTPKFHQEDLSIGDKLLRLFDLDSTYGPCMGLTRLQRWERASRLGKNPPIEIKHLLESTSRPELEYSVFGHF